MNRYFIGVDVGTGSVKGLAVDTTGKVLSTSQLPYDTIHPRDGYCEQDPDVILASFIRCVANLTKQLGKPEGISLSTAMHSVIFVDAKCKPRSPMITWADNRAADIAEKLRRSPEGKITYEENGTPIHAMTPLCKIIWFNEHDKSTVNESSKIISIKEYIWYHLFKKFEVDHSIASATGLMNVHTLKWNESTLSSINLDINKFSELVPTNFQRSGVVPEIAKQLGFDSSTIVVAGASDGCMANLGSFAIDPGIAALTIGTSGAVRVASKTPIVNFSSMTFNYRLDEYTFICGGPTNNGGIVFKWYAENLLGRKLNSAEDYNELIKLIKQVPPGCEGLVFVPYILGERAPVWDSEATGLFSGIKHLHTQPYFTRAVLEGICMALYSIAESMEQGGLNIKQLNVSGGFVHATTWLEIMANVFNKNVFLINTSDASALGAAYLGMKTTGMVSSYDEMKTRESTVISPGTDNEIYKKHYQQYSHWMKSLSKK